MADDCFNKILGLDDETKKKIFGDRPIPKDVLRRFVDDVEAIKRSASESPELGSFKSRLNEYVKKQREFNKITKEVRKNDLQIAKRLMLYAKQEGFEGDVVEAIKSRLSVPASKLAANMRDSAETKGYAIAQKLRTFVQGRLDEGDFRILKSGQLDKEIGMEMRALGENRGQGATKNEVAQRIAKTLYEGNQLLLKEMRDSGVPVREMPEYVAPLTHDIPTVRNAGEAEWVSKVIDLPLDRKAVFGESAGDRAKEIEILKDIYKGVSLGKNGVKTSLTVDSFDELVYGTNLTRKLTESRQLRFLNYEGEHQYDQMFGKSNLYERIFSNYDRKGRALGLIQTFGSNPERMIRTTLSRLEGEFRSSGNFEAADRIKRESETVMHVYHEVSGKAATPGDNVAASIGQGVRTMNVLSKLWNTGLRSIGNFPAAAMALKAYTGGNFFEHLGGILKEFTASMAPGAADRMQKEIGFFVLDFAQELNGEFGGGVGGTGLAGKSARLMFKANLMDTMNTRLKTSFSRLLMTDIAENARKPWAEIDPRLRASMLTIGVNEKDFALLHHAIETMPDGREMLTPQGIRSIPEDLVKERVKSLKEEIGGKQMTTGRYLTELENKYFGLIIQGSNVSTTSAGARERAVFTRGTYKGETWGETLRLFGQFKSFWAQNYNMMLMAMNADPDVAKLNRGILSSGKKDLMTPAQWLVTATAFGYIGQSLIDMAQGKAPEDPLNKETWIKAMARGGAGGMYADILLGDFKSLKDFGAAESILGPTFGQLYGPGVKLWGQVGNDVMNDNPLSTQKGLGTHQQVNMATRLIRNNIPFQQAIGMKQLLDYAQYDVIQESLTPGYKAKKAVREMLKDRKNRINFGGEEP
jgi:hypothetical protein